MDFFNIQHFLINLIIDLFIVIENYVIKIFGVLLEKVLNIEIYKIILTFFCESF